jgi:hypothetical protein
MRSFPPRCREDTESAEPDPEHDRGRPLTREVRSGVTEDGERYIAQAVSEKPSSRRTEGKVHILLLQSIKTDGGKVKISIE